MLRLAGPVVRGRTGLDGDGDRRHDRRRPASAPRRPASVGLGNNLHIAVAIFGLGLLLGLDTMVSQEHGAGLDDAGPAVALPRGLPWPWPSPPLLMMMVLALIPQLPGWGIRPSHPGAERSPTSEALVWSTGPLMVYGALPAILAGGGDRQADHLCAGDGQPGERRGGLGLRLWPPRDSRPMGVEGSGWATCVARVYLMAVGIGAFLIGTGVGRVRGASASPEDRVGSAGPVAGVGLAGGVAGDSGGRPSSPRPRRWRVET